MAQLTAIQKVDDGYINNWTIPPSGEDVLGAPPKTPPHTGIVQNRDYDDQSILLTQAVIYEIENDSKVLLQNVSENEDDFIEWSQHGDPCGSWMRLDVGNMLELAPHTTLFLYNRTHKQNSVMAVFAEQ